MLLEIRKSLESGPELKFLGQQMNKELEKNLNTHTIVFFFFPLL